MIVIAHMNPPAFSQQHLELIVARAQAQADHADSLLEIYIAEGMSVPPEVWQRHKEMRSESWHRLRAYFEWVRTQ